MKNVGSGWRVAVLSMTLALMGAGAAFASDGATAAPSGSGGGAPVAGGGNSGENVTSPDDCMAAYLRHISICNELFCESYWFFTTCSSGIKACRINAQLTFDSCQASAGA